MSHQIIIHRLSEHTPMPAYQTPGAAAFDLAVIESKPIPPGEVVFFQTGLVVHVPKDHVLLLLPRSSNAKKHIQLANSVGVIDQDYCGPKDELRLALCNFGTEPYTPEIGERLAQGLLVPITIGTFIETPSEESAHQDRGGFGTTG